jgi:hypothetical protein
MRRLAFMARDAGAAAALTPVAVRLLGEGATLSVVGFGRAATVFATGGLPVLGFPDPPSPEQIRRFFEFERPQALISGTSMKPAEDGEWWRAARAAGVPSLALLDHWSNLRERFSDHSPLDRLPDLVGVMDAAAHETLIQAGLPPDRLRITGQPYFDSLAHSGVTDQRANARQELGVSEDEILLVFASEPQARYYGSGPADPGWLGYTERDALDALLSAAPGVIGQGAILIKLHPLEPPGAFWELACARTGENVRTRVLSRYPSSSVIAAADVVVGMTSIILLEAATVGVPSISVRPGGGRNSFIALHGDYVQDITDAAELPAALQDALTRARPGRQTLTPEFGQNSIERVMRVLDEQLAVRVAAIG